MKYKISHNEDGNAILETALIDYDLITNPLLNKGMAFTKEERDDFGLHGLLPPQVATLEEQLNRSYSVFQSKPTDLEKYIYLRDLQDSNETLFYHLVTTYIQELLPYIYTPVVGQGCQKFSHIYRRPRGMFISYPNMDKIDQILSNVRFDNITMIVVSDGERILGLGDQGAGGMGIPIGKLSLYTAAAGIHPRATLPVLLDVGTNNPDLLNDPLYIGWRHERIRDEEYDQFIDAFVEGVKKRFPKAVLQWEDFSQNNATTILDRYQDELCTFNDDIQGTAAVVTSVLISAIEIAGVPLEELRVVMSGAGSAGCGIANLIIELMLEQGMSEKEATSRFYLLNSKGLLIEDRPNLHHFQKKFCHSKEEVAAWPCDPMSKVSLSEVVKHVKPHILVGVSGRAKLFTEEIVSEMASHVRHPIIVPLSNPTACCEADPADLMKWTQNRVIIGTGSPFPDVIREGKSFRVDQTNNSYIFPGVGLGTIAVKATRVTNSMLLAAAKALADASPSKGDHKANLLPPLTELREVTFKVAKGVAEEAILAGVAKAHTDEEIEKCIHDSMWTPTYYKFKKIQKG